MNPHPQFSRLKRELKPVAGQHAEPWRRSAFRCVEPKWARPEYLISGEGTRKHGSRWMARGHTPAVYASSTELIALKEARHNFTRYGIRSRPKPRVLVELEVKLGGIVALPPTLDALGWPDLDELLLEDWEAVNDGGVESLSQALGRALWELGHEGLEIPSGRDRRGRNLIWFPAKLRADSSIRILGKDELERWIAL